MDDDRVLDALREARDWLAKQQGVSYAELRFVDEGNESIRVRDGRVEAVQESDATGFGVRVIADGGWGFASVRGHRAEDAVRAARRALEVAKATAPTVRERVRLAPIEPSRGMYETKVARDPFAVSTDEKIDLLVRSTDRARKGDARVRRAEARMGWNRVRKALVTTDGTEVVQRFVYGGAGVSCFAVGDDGVAQRRSLPAAMDGEAGQGGYERVDAMDLESIAERAREESVALLSAPQLDARSNTTVLL